MELKTRKNRGALQFADQIITIGGNNQQASGTVTIGDATPFQGLVTPYVGQVLTATLSGLVDLDGVPINPATGMPVGLTFEWQTTEFGKNSGWTTITTGLTYTVRGVDPGHVLRAVAVFQDANGNNERIISAATDNPTALFNVHENSVDGTMVGLQIPFSVDNGSQSINGAPPVDVDLTTLYHEIDPLNSSGGRFTVVANGVDFNGFPRYSLVVDNGGPALLNYEAPVHTADNQSYQFVDNQYQVVINTHSDSPANGGVLVAVRQFTVILNNVTGEIAEVAPVVDLTGNYSVVTSTTFSENFGTNNVTGYIDADGAWTQDWVEAGDDGSSTNANGQIRITGNALVFDADSPNTFGTASAGASITRTVDLSGAASATLAFSYLELGFDAADGETVQVQFAANGTTFTTIQTISETSNLGSSSLNLTGPFSANSAIRFVVSGVNGVGETVIIDNIVITKNVATTVPGAAGNNCTTTFVEPDTAANGAAVAISTHANVLDNNSEVMSGKVTLTNAQAGDVLPIAGALPGGIASRIDLSVAGQITVHLSGAATLAQYQAAIDAVRFQNTSQNPNTTPRTITVSVHDGVTISNIAAATVNVVNSNEAMVANNDNVITNIVDGSAFTLPEWVFLVNDTDADSAVDITAVTEASSGFTAVLGGSGITITDTDGNNNSFTYTGTGTDTANVNVGRDTVGTVGASNNADIIVGNAANSTFTGVGGNDTIFAGGGNDNIVWAVDGGRDFMDGQAGALDRATINGDNSAEVFGVYSNTDDWDGGGVGTGSSAAHAGLTGLNAATEIVITRNGVIIAELDNIEEITINTSGGDDTVNGVGDFTGTSLSFNTITVGGRDGSDTVDVTGLTSDHHVHLNGIGGDDQIANSARNAAISRNEIADSNARNANVLKAMGMAGRAVKKFNVANEDHLDLQTSTSDISGTLGALSRVLRMILQSAVLGLGAYLPQEVALVGATIEQNIARLEENADPNAVVAAAMAAGVHDMIVRLPDGYQTSLGASGMALSAGQWQRLGLARALYGDPFLVILDEPNSNLDTEGEAALTVAIKAIRARGGIVIVVAHRPSALAAVNFIAVIQNGKLTAFGPKDEILSPRAAPAPVENVDMPRRIAGLPS